jgi:hypothetical protein
MNTTKLPQDTEAPAVGVPVECSVRPPLPYAKAIDLYLAYRRKQAQFFLRYHGSEPRPVTGLSLGVNCVWVEAGPMLPVHIRADGTSKDGPAIWLEAG